MSLSIQGTLTQGTNQQNIISAGNQATFTYIVQNSGPDLANNITLIDNLSSAVTGVPLTFVSASVSSGTCGGVSTNAIVSCTLPSLQAGSTATVTIVVTPNGTATGNPQTFNGGAVQLMAPGNIVLAQTSVQGLTMSDFSMAVSPLTQSVAQAGLTANYTVVLEPHPLYASSITVSCSNLPTGASCRATPSSSITLQGGSPSSVGLAVTTTARPVTTGAANFLRRSFYALWLAFPGITVARRWRQRPSAAGCGSFDALRDVQHAPVHSSVQQEYDADAGQRNASWQLHNHDHGVVRKRFQVCDSHTFGSVNERVAMRPHAAGGKLSLKNFERSLKRRRTACGDPSPRQFRTGESCRAGPCS